MREHQYHIDSFCWLLTLTDSTRVVVFDRRLRDEMISSRLAQAAHTEFKVASFKSRYAISAPNDEISALVAIARYFLRDYDPMNYDATMDQLVANLNAIEFNQTGESK